jgi:hypothetical protein
MNPSVARSAEMLGEASSVAAAAADLAAVSGKCTRRFVPSAALTQRFLSYPEVTGRSTAATASGQCVVSF